MNKKNLPYKLFHTTACLFMMLALLWLTTSTPFFVDLKKEINQQYGVTYSNDLQKQAVNEDSSPYSGLNEEQCNGCNGLSEYLHEAISITPFIPQQITHNSFIDGNIYIHYCGELLSPPPEVC